MSDPREKFLKRLDDSATPLLGDGGVIDRRYTGRVPPVVMAIMVAAGPCDLHAMAWRYNGMGGGVMQLRV